MLAYNGKFIEGKIHPYGIADIDSKQYSVENQRQQHGQMGVAPGHDYKDEDGQDNISGNILERIVDGVIFLSEEIAQYHTDSIGDETSPSTSPIAEVRYEDDIEDDEH